MRSSRPSQIEEVEASPKPKRPSAIQRIMSAPLLKRASKIGIVFKPWKWRAKKPVESLVPIATGKHLLLFSFS
jgi:hypothetical protein